MTARWAAVLARPVRLRVVAKFLGELLLTFGGLAALPLLIAVFEADWTFVARLLPPSLAVLLLAVPAARLKVPEDLRRNEGLLVALLAFVLAAAWGTWPLMGGGLGFLPALFESISAITTTGLSLDPAFWERGVAHLFLRSWMQWYGGLVILQAALWIVFTPGAAARRLGALGMDERGQVGTTLHRARRVLLAYLLLTVFAFLVLLLLTGSPLTAAVHALTSLSTGGFSTGPQSLGGLEGPAAALATIFFAFIGAVSITLLWSGGRPDLKAIASDGDLRLYLLLLAVLILLLFLLLPAAGGIAKRGLEAVVLAVSAQSTTGYSLTAVSELPASVKALLLSAMFIGGDVGSTAGGIKVFRLLILLRLLYLVLQRAALPPHAVSPLWVNGRRIQADELENVVAVVTAFGLAEILLWLPFVAWGYDPLDSLFDVVSAVSTVGLSTGVAAPGLPQPLAVLLMIGMLLGRLEVMAVIAVLMPRNWLPRKV